MYLEQISESINNEDVDLFLSTLNHLDDSSFLAFLGKEVNHKNIVDFLYEHQLYDFVIPICRQIDSRGLLPHPHPFLFAISHKHQDVIDLFLDPTSFTYQNLNAVKSHNEGNLLHHIYQNKTPHLTHSLLQAGVYPFKNDAKNQDAIESCILNGYGEDFFQGYMNHSDIDDYFKDTYITLLAKENNYQQLDFVFDYYEIEEHEYEQALNIALDWGHIKTACSILKRKHFIFSKQQIDSLLLTATHSKNANKLNEITYISDLLLSFGVKYETYHFSDGTLLWNRLSRNKNTQVLDYFLHKSKALHHSDFSDHENPLSFAIREQNAFAVQQLIRKGLDVGYIDILSYTPLLRAVSSQNIDVVKAVLDNPTTILPNINHSTSSGLTSLDIAYKTRNIHLINELLWHGAEVQYLQVFKKSYHSKNENDPLLHLKQTKNPLMSFSLLGFNPNQKRDNTPLLHYFIENNLRENTTALLKLPVDINNINSAGKTALHVAAEKNNNFYFLSLLTFKGYYANFLAVDNSNQTVCDIVAKNNDIDKALAIIDNRYILPTEEITKILPMLIKEKDLSILSQPLQKYTDTLKDFVYEDGETILSLIKKNTTTEDVEWLIKGGFIDNSQTTPYQKTTFTPN